MAVLHLLLEWAHYNLENYDKALDYYNQSLESYIKLYHQQDHIDIVSALSEVAKVYIRKIEYKNALITSLKASKMCKRLSEEPKIDRFIVDSFARHFRLDKKSISKEIKDSIDNFLDYDFHYKAAKNLVLPGAPLNIIIGSHSSRNNSNNNSDDDNKQ